MQLDSQHSSLKLARSSTFLQCLRRTSLWKKILEQSTFEINGQERDGITFSGEEGGTFPRETQRVVITGGMSATTVPGMDVSVGALD